MNTKISEWVSVGHPDRMADYIASCIIKEIYAKDGKKAHAAIEVAVFDNKVIVGGEATTTLDLTPANLAPIIKYAIYQIGYDQNYRNKFSQQECYIADDYEVLVFVNKQSPDIAKGTTDKVDTEPGWNDQGTYVGYCSTEFDTHGLSIPHYIATSFGNYLYQKALKSNQLGIDIKTLVVYKEDKNIQKVSNITVAIPFVNESPTELVMNLFEGWMLTQPQSINQLFSDGVEFLVNGTGIYKVHGSKGDSGLTGRKLVVNQCGQFAAGGSMIKPILASDRLLNLYARHVAKVICESGLSKDVTVELSASIGQTYLGSMKIICSDKDRALGELLEEYFLSIPVSPNILNQEWKTLERNNYNEAVFNNFFGSTDYTIEPWEEIKTQEKENLLDFIAKRKI